MGTIVNCECGWTVRGESEELVLDQVEQHIGDYHPEMADSITREDIRAMAEEEPTTR
jgi:predicted small metal-binding protein